MNTLIQLLMSPAIVSLLVGLTVGIFTSVVFPTMLVDIISLYLIFTIGFKGGMCLGIANQCTPPLLLLTAIGLVIGFIQPFIHYAILRKTTDLDRINAAAVATAYGSISIVTFITAVAFLNESNVPYDNFMSALAGIMEIPALFSGLWLLHKEQRRQDSNNFGVITDIIQAVLATKKIMVIFVGFFVGFLLRDYQKAPFAQLIVAPFTIILVLFMLDIGIKIAKQRSYIAQLRPSVLAFAIYMPIINGSIGLFITHLLSVEIGSAVLFALLLASASYIAVPALIRTQTDKAKEAIYLPLALGITLPFNVLVSLPLFYYIALYMA
jgi:uncharacterized protein